MAAKSNCPWSLPVDSGQTTSLKDVMDEQLASKLQEAENGVSENEPSKDVKNGDLTDEKLAKILSEDTTDDDLMIAQMLQMQFDKEYDQALGYQENHHNGTSKVTVSYQKYRMIPDNKIWDDSDDEDEELAAYLDMDEKKRHWDW